MIKDRVGLLEFSRQLNNVSEACQIMGYSRDAFYGCKEMYENGGEDVRKDLTRRTSRC